MAEPRRNTRVAKTAKTKPMDEYGHLQPQAPELEEAVLGALMIEKDAYSLVSEILRPESFYEHRHQLIYAAITDLAIQQKPIDILTVAEQLRSRGNLEEAGGPFYITQLSGKVASSAHIEYHARIIAQKFLARELISFTSNIQTKAFDETQDVDDLMQEAEGKLFEISQQNMKNEIQTYENNLGFLTSSSKKGSSLVTEMNRKVEKLKADLELILKKIEVIDQSMKDE